MKEKLFHDILDSFLCLATVVKDGKELYVNRSEDLFLADENRRRFFTGDLYESGEFAEFTLKASDQAAVRTLLYIGEYPIFYIVSQREDSGYRVIIGPFVVGFIDGHTLHDYGKKHGMKIPLMTALPMLSIFQGLDYLCIVLEMLYDCDFEYDPHEMEVFFSDKDTGADSARRFLFTMDEWDPDQHAPFSFEQAFERAIISGDRTGLAKLTGGFSLSGVGKIAGDSRKQMEYMAVVLVTLVSRIAIRAGMSEALAYRLSDRFLQRISTEKTTKGMYVICGEVIDTYMKEIQAARSDHVDSLHIERAKSFIRSRRNRPLTAAAVADAVGISGSYLSALFRQYEETSVKHFILKTKLEGAANVLRNSDRGIAEIAEYFCFSSPSHFSSKFREYYGCTPGEYRKR